MDDATTTIGLAGFKRYFFAANPAAGTVLLRIFNVQPLILLQNGRDCTLSTAAI